MRLENVSDVGSSLEESNFDDLATAMKATISKDVAVLAKQNPRRAFLKGVFVTGLAAGIGAGILGAVTNAQAGETLCFGCVGSCKEHCKGACNGQCQPCETGKEKE